MTDTDIRSHQIYSH